MKEIPEHIRLRRCILSRLYELFKKFPYAAIELKQIEEDCRIEANEINWNMVYLEKCGFIELGKSIENPPYIASSVSLTAGGIDLIESEDEFNQRFPGSLPERGIENDSP